MTDPSNPQPNVSSNALEARRSPAVNIVPEAILVRSGQLAVTLYGKFINVGLSSQQSARTYRSMTRSFFIWGNALIAVQKRHKKELWWNILAGHRAEECF